MEILDISIWQMFLFLLRLTAAAMMVGVTIGIPLIILVAFFEGAGRNS